MLKKTFSILSFSCLFILYFSISAFAQETQGSIVNAKNIFEEKGKLKLGITISAGSGLNKITVGKTTDNEEITISGGGGVGLSAVLGYLIFDEFETDLGIGFQSNTLSKKVENAEGSFSKTILSFTPKYLILIGNSNQINIGAGVGYYIPGDMDIDASKVTNGFHEIVSYDPAVGFHVLAEYEGFFEAFSHLLSWSAGVQYTSVSFEASSFKRNGVEHSVSILKDDYKTLDGNGVNFIGGIKIHL
jgi:hypothetical protein